jgi:hypothetical protein
MVLAGVGSSSRASDDLGARAETDIGAHGEAAEFYFWLDQRVLGQ